jgi:hypothetical protein
MCGSILLSLHIFVPRALSLVVDSQKRVVTTSEFAQLLGQPVTTIKRLFANEVLNAELVDKTNGGHWRIRFSPDDLRQCTANIAIWQVLRRKPRIARSYSVRDPVQSFGAELLLLEDEINSGNQIARTLRARVKSQSLRLKQRMLKNKLKAYEQALSMLKKQPLPDNEALWWYRQMLAHPQLFAATFVLRVAVQRYRAKHDRLPKQRELAETLNVSERSLYRKPFGRGPLCRAYYGRRPADVEIEDVATDDRSESYIHDSEEELSPEERKCRKRKGIPLGFHDVQRRRGLGEQTCRQSTRKRECSLELAWESDHIGRNPGGTLLVFQTSKIEAKRRLETVEREPTYRDARPHPRGIVKRQSRKIRRDLNLRDRDPTFGGRGIAGYAVQPGGKCLWWTNFPGGGEGYVDSVVQARRDIMSTIARCKTRFPIVNLAEMLAESRHH